jgi:hypothetical protein
MDDTGHTNHTQEGVTDIKPVVQRKESRIRTNLEVAQQGRSPPFCSAEEAPAYVANGNNGTAYTCGHPCSQMADLRICKPTHMNKDGQWNQ